jgi:hypothetical protein
LANTVPDSQLAAINAAQVVAKRGLVFLLEVARAFGVPGSFLERDSSGEHMVLRLDAWQALSQTQQFAWLSSYVSEENQPCYSSRHPEFAKLVGWQATSGANCFSTALLGHAPHLRGIPDWLQPHTLLRLLEQRGYTEYNTSHLQPHDVLLWKRGEHVVHACAYLGKGMVLNKDSQAWYSPRQVLPLEVVQERWDEADLLCCVYARL